MRGRIYVKDGAIETWELSPDGCHQTPSDPESWHLLVLDDRGRVSGCARYREHGTGEPTSSLGVSASPLAVSEEWESLLGQSIESERALARSLNFSFVEVGGWAIAEDCRSTKDAARLALSVYALARLLGGCIGITTATFRHSSSSILRRIGGCGLQAHGVELPSYYDPRYKSEMVILRFNSSAPDLRFSPLIDELASYLPQVSVVQANAGEKTQLVPYRQEYCHKMAHTERYETLETA